MNEGKLIPKIEKEIGSNLKDFLKVEYTTNFRSLNDIGKQIGISRSHLSNFMRKNNINIRNPAQSRFKIIRIPTREEIAVDYLDKRMKLREMELKWGLSRGTIYLLVKKYNLPILSKKDKSLINRIRWFMDDEYQIILGSILGDANLNKTPKSALFEESHCMRQEEYLLWKRKYALSRFKTQIKYYPTKVRLWTEVSPLFADLRKRLYPLGKKIITKEILEELKPLGIAVWFMDDGSMNLRSGGDLSTDGFTENENYLIRDYFNNKRFFCKVIKRKYNGTYKIIFNNEGFNNLINCIGKYIHPCMNYKIDAIRRKDYYELEKYKKHMALIQGVKIK